MEHAKALATIPEPAGVADTLRRIAAQVEAGQCVVTRLELYSDTTLQFDLVVKGYAVPVKRIGG